MRRIFWGFCRNWFLMSPLHYLLSRSDFGFEFAEIFVFANSLHHWYAESATPRITDMESRAYWIFLKKTLRIDDTESRRLPAPVIRWVADSPYRWVGESPTPRSTDTESRRLRISLRRGVDDSADRWYGSRYSRKKLIWCRFSELLTAKPCL